MDAETAGHFSHGFTFFQQSLGEVPLIGIHFFRSSEADAALFSVRPACAGSFAN
jgi:hypothetical protein